MVMSLESFVTDVIEGRRNRGLLAPFFWCLSKVYSCLVAIRHFLYDKDVFSSFKSPLPVVSIGNIVAGGTGKTPLMQKLLQDLNWNPGDAIIVTRGYRKSSKIKGSFAASLGFGPMVDVSFCGDEAFWLAFHTSASVWVGSNRVESIKKATSSKTSAKMIFLEDGFQHRKVRRDIEIVLVSAKDLFGKGAFLPQGYLRDFPSRLANADWIIVTHLTQNDHKGILEREIRRFSKAPIIGFSSKYQMTIPIEGKKVGAFCAIAKPQFFYDALVSEGSEIVDVCTLPDHKAPSEKSLVDFANRCKKKGAQYLVCTEKDAVKRSSMIVAGLPIVVCKMEMVCSWNEKFWKEMLHSIQTRG